MPNESLRLAGKSMDSVKCWCREEDWASGGVIVQDCLDLLLHLLKKNVGNQLMFRWDAQPRDFAGAEIL